MSLEGVGRTSVLCYAKYAEKKNYTILSEQDYLSLMDVCHEKEGCRTKAEKYCRLDIKEAELTAEKIIAKSEALGIRITSYSDADFPAKLKCIISQKVSKKGIVTEKDESPVVLYYKGDNISKLNELNSAAIIGTREPTAEGEQAGVYIAKEFAKQGFNIVGGLAIGCDTCGHQGAILANGITTAFLAHGLHTIYPKENEHLAEAIVNNGGLLISEYPVGVEPYAPQFVERDRLQSGLSDVTIVIQTGISGGTMHAVNSTIDNKKPLFAVAYVDERVKREEKVLGNEKLLREGTAMPITSGNTSECISKVLAVSKQANPTSKNNSETHQAGVQLELW